MYSKSQQPLFRIKDQEVTLSELVEEKIYRGMLAELKKASVMVQINNVRLIAADW